METSIATLDNFCQQSHQSLCPWGSGGQDAKELIEMILMSNNSGVSMQQWPVKKRQKVATWLKRERGITLYLQRKRTKVKNHDGDYIPYYIDHVFANVLGLKKTPHNATPYTHSVRVTQRTNNSKRRGRPVKTQSSTEFAHEQEWCIPSDVETESVMHPQMLHELPNSFTYGLNLFNDQPLHQDASSETFSSYFYYPADPYYFAIPPLENTNQASNVVS